MTLFFVGLGLILAGGVMGGWHDVAQVRWRAAAYQLLLAAGGAVAAIPAAMVLASGRRLETGVVATMPGAGWAFGMDALSAVFALAVLVVGVLCAIYGVHDTGGDSSHARRTSPFFFALTLDALALVLVARTTFAFLTSWEIMAIGSYLLIVTHHESAEVRRAGLVYLVATHAATLGLFAMFAIWQAHAANGAFTSLASAAGSLSPGAVAAILMLALVGFGVKAGLVPLHFWLPPAHASSPADVSALMSGLVIKMGIYGLLRVLLLLGGAPAWWGWLMLALGAVSGVLGVLWALAQHDFKRLLAYHSVENIGIIAIGIGTGVLGVAHGSPVVAALGFAGAVLHTVNHALFKSLLFLGAGAVYRVTGTRNMEALGGVARRMPVTWLLFIVGAAAIIGVPPFNGFISEWLVYQGMFQSGLSSDRLHLVLLGIPALALIGGLALACFAKVAGVVFLGTARSPAADAARERGAGSLAPMVLLASACVTIGMLPSFGLSLVEPAARDLSRAMGGVIPPGVRDGAWTISVIAGATVLGAALLWFVRDALTRRNGVRFATTWGCGYDAPSPRMQYTASSFAAPLLSIFGRLSSVHVERTPSSLHTHPVDPVLDRAATPLWGALHRSALRFRGIQHGRLHLYLLYVLGALVALLGYLVLGPRQ
ncbi:MAG TPA: proton-conducting transporter membrane subunit [Gemmatimonadaceae bacterium]|nr:proton-conducting transporter membrane subunit [Gemmatimonadaceae bacterium]